MKLNNITSVLIVYSIGANDIRMVVQMLLQGTPGPPGPPGSTVSFPYFLTRTANEQFALEEEEEWRSSIWIIFSDERALQSSSGYIVYHPASRAFLLLARFWRSRQRLCMNRLRFLLSMCCMLPGYSLEPKPNMPDLVAILVFTVQGVNYNHQLYYLYSCFQRHNMPQRS